MLKGAGKVEWWGHWGRLGQLGCAWFWLVASWFAVPVQQQKRMPSSTSRATEPLLFLVASASQWRLMLLIIARLCFTAWRLAMLAVVYSPRSPCLPNSKAGQEGKSSWFATQNVEWLGGSLDPPPHPGRAAHQPAGTHTQATWHETLRACVSGRSSEVTVSGECWTFGGASRVQP